jgi:hypothetical protein
VALLSVVSNTLPVLLELTIGIVIGSVSVISEALHSFVDLTVVIAPFAVGTSGKPADTVHPFGHGTVENKSGAFEARLYSWRKSNSCPPSPCSPSFSVLIAPEEMLARALKQASREASFLYAPVLDRHLEAMAAPAVPWSSSSMTSLHGLMLLNSLSTRRGSL